MANTYTTGATVRTSVAYTSGGVATDPTTVTLSLKTTTQQNMPTTIYTFGSSSIVKDSTGNYHFDIATAASGVWFYRWVGSGVVNAASEGQFTAASPGSFV